LIPLLIFSHEMPIGAGRLGFRGHSPQGCQTGKKLSSYPCTPFLGYLYYPNPQR
jgi:hypothetical protein